MFKQSILAGIFISLAAIVYLSVGGVAGALMFSVGLLAVLRFDAALFTGKAGLLSQNGIESMDLLGIWIGNYIGTFFTALVWLMTPRGEELAYSAMAIVAARVANGPLANFVLGIGCGLLMYIAVKAEQPVLTILAVAAFIVSGFCHCVADMFYINVGMMEIADLLQLIPVTAGNLVGTNIIPVLQRE